MIRVARRVASCTMTLVAAAGPLVAQTTPVAQQFENLHFRSIGPATMSGRIADLAIYEKNPAIWYVGTAHGGVWKTTSNGISWTPLLQDKGLLSIGDVTVSQSNPDVLYVGTGESNNRQSISWGEGVWKTTDGGKTFEHIGLRESKAINRIIIDPTNDNVVLVAATGSLWGPGGERGVYKTTDGGRNWKRVLFVDDETGATDLAMSATDPKTIYAAMYQRRRTNCCVNGGGPGSGIWKSTDGGETWTRLTNGIPAGPLGRIGLDAYRKNGNIVYASIEGPSAGRGGRGAVPEPEAPPVAGGGRGGGGGGGGGGQGGAAGTTGLYRSDDGGATWRRVSSVNPRPLYFSQVRIDPNNADHVYMGGVGLQMTIDGGRTMETDAALTTHDDVHAIWIDPANSDHIVIGNDGGIAVSWDKSQNWQFIPNLPVGLFYHVNYDMSYPYIVCGGMQDNYDWCGPSASRHRAGIMNYDWYQIQGGDGFVAIPDRRDSRWVYTESQDGNITRRNRITGESKAIRPNAQNVSPAPAAGESYRFHWDTPMIVSPNDPGLLIVAANKVFTSRDRGDSWTVISPDLTTRVSRDTVVTMGVRGSEIRNSTNDGISQYPAIVSLAESPKQAGVYYTGTDDGLVHVSRDGGKSWQNITPNIPGFPTGAYVSEVVPSAFDAATVYVTVDHHRQNDFKPYMWVSNDFGQTFRSMVGNLTGEVVRTLTEDVRNRDVLYIGTETGIFLTLDRGRSWSRLKANFPTVRVDEITLHPRDNAMLVASHGRAIWILDHLEPIQEYTAAQAVDAKLFSVPNALQWKMKDDRNDEFWGHQTFIGENPPEAAVIQYFLKSPATDPKIRITDAANRPVRELAIPAAKNVAGIQTVCWDMRGEPIAVPDEGGRGGAGAGAGGRGGAPGGGRGNPAVPGVPVPIPSAGYMPADPCAGPGGGGGGGRGGFGGGGGLGGPAPFVVPGTYTVALVAGGKVVESKTMKVIADPDVKFAAGEAERYNTIVTDLHNMQRRAVNVAVALNTLHPQMADVAKKVSENSAIPANVKTQFENLNKDYEAVRKKFGVPTNAPAAAAGRGGGGGGRGGPPIDPENVLARTSALKNAAQGIWEPLSPSMSRTYTDVKLALPKAITDANALLTRAAAVSTALRRYDITLTVPAVQR